ncbi:hypothetical protein [Prosthecobacter fusiformis]|nr:hypothetical protein [Prosthecobacter fusiformis]
MLLLCGFMAAVAVAFLSSSSIQNNAARLDQADVLTDELLQAAQQEVLAKLHEGFSVEVSGAYKGHVAAAPGLLEVRRYYTPWNRGTQVGAAAFLGTPASPAPFSQPFSSKYGKNLANPRYIPLFSWKTFAPRLKNITVRNGSPARTNPDYNPSLSFNLNTPRNPFTPGACLLSGVPEESEALIRERIGKDWSGDGFRIGTGQTSAERPVWVQWIPILKDPALPASVTNPIIGRYAYWVDLENTKLHVGEPMQDLRETRQYARLIGEPDAVEKGGSWYDQGASSSMRALRLALEGGLPAVEKGSAGFTARNGSSGIGFAPGAAQEARNSWLGWVDGRPPMAAGTRVVDWSFFCAPWPRGFQDFTIGTILQKRYREWENSPAEKPVHPWLLRLPQTNDESDETQAKAALLTQVATAGLTNFGHEEELDPLGRPKLSLMEFQLAATANRSTTVSLTSIEGSTLWKRVTDDAYAACYFPGLLPMKGVKKSLADSFNQFAGTGNAGGKSNGKAAMLQMLVNVAEAAQPDTVAPVIDADKGIVGARSMPYVAEVSTRARSALWLLPEDIRSDKDVLLKLNAQGGYEFKHPYENVERNLRFYATHVTVDLCLGLVNPNPFETEMFTGEIEVDVDWGPLPSTAIVKKGWLKATLEGQYALTPEAGKDPKAGRVTGHAVNIHLGVVPASILNDNARASALRIKGWRILRNGQVWHQVPIRHPGGSAPREWWQMAASGNNAGSPSSASDDESLQSLHAYTEGGYRAVGWFTKRTMDSLIPQTLFVTGWTGDGQKDAQLKERVEFWENFTRRTAVLERVVSLDPVVGHRTGTASPAGFFGSGHFYGMLGHTWRHAPVMPQVADLPAVAPASGQKFPPLKVKSSTAQLWTVLAGGSTSHNVQVRQPGEDRLRKGSVSWDIPTWTTQADATLYGGEYLTQEYEQGTASEEEDEEDEDLGEPGLPASLTAIYLCPAVEGPAPQGKLPFYEQKDDDGFTINYSKDGTAATASFRSMDVELDDAGKIPAIDKDYIKRGDNKKGPRSFFCSAPPKRPFVSVGEIGFCHSGFPQTPILVGPEEGRTEYQLNSPRNGPPMRMLLDLLAAPRFTNALGGTVSETEWMGGQASTSSHRHAWNVNTLIAHDDYMALRQGGSTLLELKKEQNPSTLPVHAVWSPNAQGFARRETGADGYLGKNAEDLVKKDPGHIQDRHLRPGINLSRPWNMWLGVIAGDFTPSRSGDSLSWGAGNSAGLFYGPALMTWRPGKGSGSGSNAWVDFKSQLPGHGRLLALGEDGRKDDKNENADYLKGRFAADQNLAALDPNLSFYMPAHFATRMSLVPMRHFISDLALDYHQNNHESDWLRLKTALNPGIGGQTPPAPDGEQDAAKKLAGAGFPGGYHSTGVYYQAPMALLTNQAGVSANAFTAYIVVQSLRDRGKARSGVANSGIGHCDPDDEILAERWARVILVKKLVANAPPTFEIVFRDIAGR